MFEFPKLPIEIQNLIHSYVDYSDFITIKNTKGTNYFLLYPGELDYVYKTPSTNSFFVEPIIINNCLQEHNINMMPFILGRDDTLPDPCKRFIPIINDCLYSCPKERNKVCYLTIQESYVDAGYTQRRAGIHTETIGLSEKSGYGTHYWYPPHWGGGDGGLFIMSNIDNSTVIYDCIVKDVAIGHNGSLEHMSSYLNKCVKKQYLKKNQLCWLTDRTPHEALPVKERCFRQFFRLVTSNVSLWYSKHSTKNPLGIEPGPDTKIIDAYKFLKISRILSVPPKPVLRSHLLK
jgi:hypothetical protein